MERIARQALADVRAAAAGYREVTLAGELASARTALAAWIEKGLLVVDEQIEEGIENAVPAFLRLFAGTHDGKLILRIAG